MKIRIAIGILIACISCSKDDDTQTSTPVKNKPLSIELEVGKGYVLDTDSSILLLVTVKKNSHPGAIQRLGYAVSEVNMEPVLSDTLYWLDVSNEVIKLDSAYMVRCPGVKRNTSIYMRPVAHAKSDCCETYFLGNSIEAFFP